jgi:hypothetical protein
MSKTEPILGIRVPYFHRIIREIVNSAAPRSASIFRIALTSANAQLLRILRRERHPLLEIACSPTRATPEFLTRR